MEQILSAILLVGAITVVGFGLVGGIPALLSAAFSKHKKDSVRFVTVWKTNQVEKDVTTIPYPVEWETARERNLRQSMGITDPNFYDDWKNSGFDTAYNYLEYTRITSNPQ